MALRDAVQAHTCYSMSGDASNFALSFTFRNRSPLTRQSTWFRCSPLKAPGQFCCWVQGLASKQDLLQGLGSSPIPELYAVLAAARSMLLAGGSCSFTTPGLFFCLHSDIIIVLLLNLRSSYYEMSARRRISYRIRLAYRPRFPLMFDCLSRPLTFWRSAAAFRGIQDELKHDPIQPAHISSTA